MPNINISFNVKRPFGLTRSRAIGSESGRWLIQALQGALGGASDASGCDGVIWTVEDGVSMDSKTAAGPATGVLVGSTLSGAVGATIDGTLVTVTAAGGDVATATALAAALRANASINRKVTATNRGMQFAVGVMTAGMFLDICNIRFTAVGAAAVNFGEFDVSSGAASTIALNLATAICRHPALAMRIRATASANAIYLFSTTDRAYTKFETIVNSAGLSNTFFSSSTPVPALMGLVGLMATVPGQIGECITVVASGTGMTFATSLIAGKLSSGTGGGSSPNFFLP